MNPDPYQFGGSEKQVRRTQKRFVGIFPAGEPVLDIGCGRGVFLRMLRDVGVEGIGIDTFESAVEQCRREGLQVTVADALSYLESPPRLFGGVFCSHVIEHMPYDAAVGLVTRVAGALQPGGIVAYVTPNFRDLGVMGETFWLDPTHVRPYPVALLSSMVQRAGLGVVDSGTFHGGLPKREWGKALLYRCLLGPFYGHPNAYVIARKPR